MNEFLQRDLAYVIRVDEILWGGLLLAVTIAIHGAGMFQTLWVSAALKNRTRKALSRTPWWGLGILILAAWMIIVVDLIEVGVWAGFLTWKGAQPNLSSAFYNAMLNYATLQAGYLPLRWRLLEGILGMAGLLTFAWSTGILFSIAQEYMEHALAVAAQRRQTRRSEPTPAAHNESGDLG